MTATIWPCPARRLPRPLELLELLAPPDKARQAPMGGHLETRAQRPDTLQLVDAQGSCTPFSVNSRVASRNSPPPASRVLRQVDAIGSGELLHTCGQSHRVPLRGVIHAQIIADPATTTSPELRPMRTEKLSPRRARSRWRTDAAPRQAQGRVARPLGVILVRDRRAKERHDAVAVYWLTVPSKRCTPSVRIWKKRSRIVCTLRINLLRQLHRPFTSANSTVTACARLQARRGGEICRQVLRSVARCEGWAADPVAD